MGKKEFLKNFWRLLKGYWLSKEKWRAGALLGAVIALNVVSVYIMVLINEWYNTFYNALQQYDQQAFWPLIGRFAALAFLYIGAGVYAIYLRQMLQIRWRRWMTAQYLDKWLAGQAYYRMQVTGDKTDNPDQRISEDIMQFVALTLELSVGALRQLAVLAAFVVILWQLSGVLTVPAGGYEVTVYGYMVWFSLLYAAAGTYLTAKIGNPLIVLNYNQQRYEADFRFRLVRLRENSESVAFYEGEGPEKGWFSVCFKDVVKNYFSLMKYGKRLTWFTSGYGQLAIIFPILLAAPRYFSGQIQLGGVMQVSSAFGNVQEALSFFVTRYSDVAQWIAVVKRLSGFTAHMESVAQEESAVERAETERPGIEIGGLTVQLPDGTVLLNRLDLSVARGDKILISGASGSGKSALLRTIAGIWPFGAGKVSFPADEKRLFLPQRPYMPLGSLRDILLYPSAGGVSDEAIQEALSLCSLDQFSPRLDLAADWSKSLSLGEQQRIAFARLLLLRPQWVFLDEATSALDEAAEKRLYELVCRRLPETAVISVGHRGTLREYHNRCLKLDGQGGWIIGWIKENQP